VSDVRTNGVTEVAAAVGGRMPTGPRVATIVAALATSLAIAACSGAPDAPGAPNATGAQGAPAATTVAPDGVAVTPAPDGAVATPAPGGPSSTLAPGVSTDACSVLVAADFQAVTGATLVTNVPAQQQGIFTNGCLYELNDGSTTTTVNVGVMVPGGGAYYDANVRDAGYGSIEGLGEAAVKARAGAVMVLADDVLLSVQYFGPTGPDDSTAAEFARKILANLGL
jgi:hypothetical protein